MTRRCDIVISGAGPAGSASASLLARAGFDVILLDRSAFPRPKPCGECLSPGARPWLERLGALPRVERAGARRLDGWRIAGHTGTGLIAGFAEAGVEHGSLALARHALDGALLENALDAGARFLPGARVHDLMREGDAVTGVLAQQGGSPLEIRARLVIGADGLRSIVARRAGCRARPPRRRKASFTMHLTGIANLDSVGEMHLSRGACAGVAPVGGFPGAEAVANLTVVVETGRCPRPPGRAPLQAWRAWLRRFPALRGRLDHARVYGGADTVRPLTSGPFDQPVNRVAGDGFALVGDAAGYYDPFTGQGVTHALEDAFAIADAAAAAFADSRGRALGTGALADYAAAHRRRTIAAHTMQRLVDALLGHAAPAAAALAWLRRSTTARSAILRATGDLLPPRDLLSPRLLAAALGEALHPVRS
jgi:menaquinone-9 beta-reductase